VPRRTSSTASFNNSAASTSRRKEDRHSASFNHCFRIKQNQIPRMFCMLTSISLSLYVYIYTYIYICSSTARQASRLTTSNTYLLDPWLLRGRKQLRRNLRICSLAIVPHLLYL
jgi:hypothetical protein